MRSRARGPPKAAVLAETRQAAWDDEFPPARPTPRRHALPGGARRGDADAGKALLRPVEARSGSELADVSRPPLSHSRDLR